ncbi:MAG: DUF4870 domain-containing protein [Bacteroidota bacterium]
MSTTNENNNAFLMHLSSFFGYVFPFGGIIAPLIFWEINKKSSELLDATGKEVINFNLSYLLYTTILTVAIVSLAINVAIDDLNQISLFFLISLAILVLVLIIVKFVMIIVAAVKSNQGGIYKYPATINFIK